MSEASLRREIAAVCRRIYQKGFVAATADDTPCANA
jgi:ribulose-5-phosphate 4-epimerase/fuculose-1-phosphate aldolase